ncbi:MAG: glutamate racemase [Pseudomonadota bacterium]
MRPGPLLVLDSGLGGLTVLRELRSSMPARRFVYVADDVAFPYGDWDEDALRERLVALIGDCLSRLRPCGVVIACNTASTLALAALRERYPETPFIGTVPAIKPAMERTGSGVVAVLATPGTVRREYTRRLIDRFAAGRSVRLVGSTALAGLAEAHLARLPLDEAAVRAEIAPCFYEEDGRRTDIVVLACTHYPLLANVFRRLAPWPVDWVDPAEAIAHRAADVLGAPPLAEAPEEPDHAVFTSGAVPASTVPILRGFGLRPAT